MPDSKHLTVSELQRLVGTSTEVTFCEKYLSGSCWYKNLRFIITEILTHNSSRYTVRFHTVNGDNLSDYYGPSADLSITPDGFRSGSSTPVFTLVQSASMLIAIPQQSGIYCNGSCGGLTKQVFCGIGPNGDTYNYCMKCKKERI